MPRPHIVSTFVVAPLTRSVLVTASSAAANSAVLSALNRRLFAFGKPIGASGSLQASGSKTTSS